MELCGIAFSANLQRPGNLGFSHYPKLSNIVRALYKKKCDFSKFKNYFLKNASKHPKTNFA